jgi:hypothetical protein
VNDWSNHKSDCRLATNSEIVTVIPTIRPFQTAISQSDLIRQAIAANDPNKTPLPDISHKIPANVTTKTQSSNLVIKVQLPYGGQREGGGALTGEGRDLMVYNSKRSFNAAIKKEGNEQAYTRLTEVISEKGVKLDGKGPGMKAYFQAELAENPQKLVIRVGDVLAEQGF